MRLAASIVLVSALSIHGAQYYVDYETGNDGNAGTTTSAPWKHCIGDPNATGIPAVLTLGAGDTVNFKAGTVYQGLWYLNQSGTSGNPITYDGQGWGVGNRCILTTSNAPTGLKAILGPSGPDWINVKNFYFTRIGGYPDDSPVWSGPPGSVNSTNDIWGGGFQLTDATHMNIENCRFDMIGMWQNLAVMDSDGLAGAGVDMRDCSYITVSGCDFSRVPYPIGINAGKGVANRSDNITITNCSISTNVWWGIDVNASTSGTSLSNLVVRSSRFYDYAQYDSGNWLGTGEKPHVNGIFMRVSSGTFKGYWTNSNTAIRGMLVDGCKFWCDDPGASDGGTASIFISDGPSATIRNCIFLNDSKQDTISISFPQYTLSDNRQSVWVLNNTFYTFKRTKLCSETANPNWVWSANNIYSRRTTGNNPPILVYSTSPTNIYFNYNLYFSAQANTNDMAVVTDITFNRPFSSWQSARHQDTNSIISNPQFVKGTGYDSTLDLSLQSISAAIGTGTNLSAFFTTDYNGNTRTNWDMGAISYGSYAPPIPGGPGTLRITAGRLTSFRSIP